MELDFGSTYTRRRGSFFRWTSASVTTVSRSVALFPCDGIVPLPKPPDGCKIISGFISNVDYKTQQFSNQYGSRTYHYFWARVDTPSGQVEVTYRSLPDANVNLGDDVGFWGGWRQGMLKANRAFNFTTNAVTLAPWYQWFQDLWYRFRGLFP